MSLDKPLIFFIDKSKPNTAFYNRYHSIYKMLQNEFETVYVKPNLKESIKNKLIRGSINRSLVITEIFKQLNKYKKRPRKLLFWGKINTLYLPFIYLICKWFKTKIVCEINEYPQKVIDGYSENWLLSFLEKNAIDGYTFISDSLVEYYRKYLVKRVKYIKLPMTVDEDRFDKSLFDNKNYIFYAGSLSNKKDGILYLINAFAKIVKNCHFSLKIAGGGSNSEVQAIKHLISQHSLEERIELLGFIDMGLIPKYLMQASILVMPRPNSIQAQGGFPSKLGEYLIAEKPVICTKIGELSSYLSEDDVFYISPDSIEDDLAKAMMEIYNNYSRASVVANNGYNRCLDTFTLKANTQRLTDFIYDLFSMENS